MLRPRLRHPGLRLQYRSSPLFSVVVDRSAKLVAFAPSLLLRPFDLNTPLAVCLLLFCCSLNRSLLHLTVAAALLFDFVVVCVCWHFFGGHSTHDVYQSMPLLSVVHLSLSLPVLARQPQFLDSLSSFTMVVGHLFSCSGTNGSLLSDQRMFTSIFEQTQMQASYWSVCHDLFSSRTDGEKKKKKLGPFTTNLIYASPSFPDTVREYTHYPSKKPIVALIEGQQKK
ncbi:MAG: hypothetical protein J3R72DRAFT_213055 [Linnemannia gamsii]|nr:MAG: hypothetical protein J3R72DRAFT_213055 [Linnemannia gamsii]